MEVGGCMYVDEDIFCQPIQSETKVETSNVETESIASSDVTGFDSIGTGTECCICYEIIGKKNNCVTECGHIFCFKCLATSMSRNNACPCCRAPLVDSTIDEGGDDESEYEESVDEEDSNDGDDESEYEDMIANKDYKGDIEEVVARMQRKGVTMLDVVSLLYNKFSKKDEKYTDDYVKTLVRMLDQINSDTESEIEELQQMSAEDTPILARLGGAVEVEV